MKAFLRYVFLLFITLFALSLYIPKRYTVSYPKSLGPDFDKKIRMTYIKNLEEDHAEIVLLGDSTLGDAVDADLLEQGLEKETLSISLPGTAATLWYLITKNNIIVSEHKPDYLVLFVRDSMLTVPHYRTTGTYFDLIDEFANNKDTVLLNKAYINRMSVGEQLAEKYFPVFGSRWRIRETIDFYIRYPLPEITIGCDKDCMIASMQEVFNEADINDKHLNEALFVADSILYKREFLDFEGTVEESFLPEIIRLCEENDIQLIIVRLETVRFPTEGVEPPDLQKYFLLLEEYLEENDVIYLNLSRNPSLRAEHFVDDLHMNDKGKAVFTPILIEALKGVFK